MTIYSLDKLLFLFATSLLFHVAVKKKKKKRLQMESFPPTDSIPRLCYSFRLLIMTFIINQSEISISTNKVVCKVRSLPYPFPKRWCPVFKKKKKISFLLLTSLLHPPSVYKNLLLRLTPGGIFLLARWDAPSFTNHWINPIRASHLFSSVEFFCFLTSPRWLNAEASSP